MSDPDEKFIELNREFRMLPPGAPAEEAASASYRYAIWQDTVLSWDDILNRFRVVILGEPGSGKTWEFQNRAAVLNSQSKSAFLILSGEYLQPAPTIPNPDYIRPAALSRFIPLICSYVRYADDIDRTDSAV